MKKIKKEKKKIKRGKNKKIEMLKRKK